MTVIVAVGNLRERAGGCLRSLLDQGLGERMEIVMLDRGRPDAAPVPGADDPSVRRLPQPPDAIFSRMRAAGVAAARAPVVAFVEEHVRVRPGWAEALLAAYAEGWAGVGAAVAVGNPGSGASDAVGLLSYGLWFHPLERGETEMLPGHNASYRTEILRGLGDDLEPLLHGDLELQRVLTARGHRLCMEPAAVIEHLCEPSFRRIATGMHLWYRCYGPLRARFQGWSPLQRALYVLATPIIPVYFVIGFFRRLGPERPAARRLLLRNLPGTLYMHFAAAWGQALGLLFGPGDAPARFTDYELHEPRPL